MQEKVRLKRSSEGIKETTNKLDVKVSISAETYLHNMHNITKKQTPLVLITFLLGV